MAWEFIENQNLFIGTRLSPDFGVPEQSADYPCYPKEYAVNMPDTKRSERGNYNRVDWKFETDTYSCVENGIEERVDDVEKKLYARYFNAEVMAARRATATILRRREKATLDIPQALSADASPTNEWDDATNAAPLADVNTGRNTIEAATGVYPNTLVIAGTTFQDLGVAATIIDRIKYTHPGVKKGELTKELLAEYLNLEQVLVSTAAYNSAKQGATAVMTKMWDEEYALLACCQTGQDLMMPSYMRTFRWTKECPSPVVVESYYNDEVRGNIVRCRDFTDIETIWAAAVYLMDNIAA